MSDDSYMDAHLVNVSWPVDSPAASAGLTVGLLMEYLSTLPKDMSVYCVQEENFSTGDKAIAYLEANLKDCFTVEEDILYIGNVDI